MDKIKWGIIGAGRISSTCATALNSLEDVEITAIASRDLNKAKEFAERFKIKKIYGNYEDIAKDPEIDVIYIGTPHSEHRANASLCIMNGKAVLCEKPFTLNRQETEYLIDLAKEHKVFLMEAMWTKFLPITLMVKKWINDKRIGDVKYINVAFGFFNKFDINNRLFNPAVGGGALLDVGVYPITYAVDMMEALPDQVVSSATLGTSHVDEQNVIILRFKQGVLADLSSGVTSDLGKDALIVGDKGKIKVPSFWRAEYAELLDEEGKLVEKSQIPHKANGFEYELEEVNRCLREGKKESERNSLGDTLNIMKIMDELRSQWGLVYPQERKQ